MGSDPAMVASALFVVGELAQYYRANDPVYYAAQFDFLDLVHSISEFSENADPHVRRQCYVAAAKAQNMKLSSTILSQLETQGNEAYLAEARASISNDSNVVSVRSAATEPVSQSSSDPRKFKVTG